MLSGSDSVALAMRNEHRSTAGVQPTRPNVPAEAVFTPFFGPSVRAGSGAAYDPHFPGAKEAQTAQAERQGPGRRALPSV